MACLGLPGPVSKPVHLVDILYFNQGVPDRLVELVPIKNPSIPGEMAVLDTDGQTVLPVDYASGFVVHPSAIEPPAWTPEPATVSLLGRGAAVLMVRRRRTGARA